MEKGKGTIQDRIRVTCSISYVAEKLGVSRPTFYKYMEQYDSGDSEKLPRQVLGFFNYMSAKERTEEDVILYFLKRDDEKEEVADSSGLETKVVSDMDRVMIVFPDADPEDTVVDLMMDFNGRKMSIATYRPQPGMRFVTIDGLVAGQTFHYEVRSGNLTSGIRSFAIASDKRLL